MIPVEKGVPLGSSRRGTPKYPWLEMEVGDSFFVPRKQGAQGAQASVVPSGAAPTGKRHHRKFTTRRVKGGIRVWKVA